MSKAPRHRTSSFNALERRAVTWLSSVYMLRMFGLFLIFPVFSLYAQDLSGSRPELIGLALGAYGLTQALLQIPFGAASDRFGRKGVIVLGLLIFAAGSVVAALATSIWGVIAGRALQGAGAIAAAVMALLADLTREEQRTKAMAVIGVSIGASMLLSLILGPAVGGVIGVDGIFWLTAVLAFGAVGVVVFVVPTPVKPKVVQGKSSRALFHSVLRDPQLVRLDLGIFVLHAVLTALFLVLPVIVVTTLNLPAPEHWKLYFPVLVLSVVTMAPFVSMTGKASSLPRVLGAAVLVLMLSQVIFYFKHQSTVGLLLALWAFFVGFNLLEATLPSLISRLAPAVAKGSAIGVYSTAQFLGAFCGGAVGGLCYARYGASGVFVFAGVGLAVWLLLIATMPRIRFFATHTVDIGKRSSAHAQDLARRLSALTGVAEAIVVAEAGVAYLKVDPDKFDEKSLKPILGK